MAIKVGSTQHLNTSGQLQNIASLDSTTATTISNAVASSGSVSAQFTRGTTAQGQTSFTAGAGMHMLQIYNTASNGAGALNLPTSNVEFGMFHMIKGTSNTQNAISVGYFYDGTDWHSNANTTGGVTILSVDNSTSGGQNVSYAWGFLTLTGSVTLTTTASWAKFNIIKVS